MHPLATRRLRERGEREARDLGETLRRQRERIVEELDLHEGQYKQITLAFDEEERRQLQSNMRYWQMRSTSSTGTWSGSRGGFGRSTRCRRGASSRSVSCTSGRRRIDDVAPRTDRAADRWNHGSVRAARR